MRRVMLGRTGIEVSQMAIGTGTHGFLGSSAQTRLGEDKLVDLLEYAYERGITWFDAADQYGSHRAVAEAVRRIGRDKVVLTTKTVAQTAGWVRKDIERFRLELDTDHLDIVLLHCMMHPWWNRLLRPVMNVLSEYQAKGIIRAVGVSNHEFGALKTTAKEPWVEVVLARLNPLGRHMEAKPEQVLPLLREMHDAGKGVYGMKVMAVGEMKSAREAIQYQLDSGCMDAFVIGMESRAEVDENVRLLEDLNSTTVSSTSGPA
ncbi:MAG: aldo/keto reductase [Candidatus Xenobia bacterium]